MTIGGRIVMPCIRLGLLAALALCAMTMRAQISDNNALLLQELDALLDHSDLYWQERLDHIQQLKQAAASTPNTEERFWLTKSIFDEYSIYDGDSALAYAKLTIDLADDLNRSDLQNELHITSSYTLAAIGHLDRSAQELDAVIADQLSDNAKIDYLGQRLYLLTHQVQYANATDAGSTISDPALAVLDSIAAIIAPTHPEYYYYTCYQAIEDPKLAHKAIAKVAPHMATLNYDSRADARLAWVVSQLYATVGDSENHLKYLILSAMADTRIGNREIASLEEIAGIMETNGDLMRAYRYIGQCLECAEKYKNRVRALRIATMQGQISDEYQNRLLQLQSETQRYLWLSILLVAVLLGAIFYIWFQHRSLALSHKQLTQANKAAMSHLQDLKGAYENLANKNEELLHMSQTRQETDAKWTAAYQAAVHAIGNAFEAASKQIDKTESLRRQIARQLRASQFDTALATTESNAALQDNIKDFCAEFDSTFLSICPDFVERYNSLLRPDERLQVKPDSLNTELRIYALVCLGITDSVSIAAVLHCSVQTVYNKRMQARNKAATARENFVDNVCRIIQFQP